MSKKPKPRYIVPTLESITIKGKYKVPVSDFREISSYLKKTLINWSIFDAIGDSLRFVQMLPSDDWGKVLKKRRPGFPADFSVIVVERTSDGMILDVTCLPTMWHKIAKFIGANLAFTENQIQEALLECQMFLKQVMSGLRGKEIEPVSVYPIILRAEIKSRLVNLGLKEIVDKLDKAEEHIVQNDFSESLKSSRTAFEKMIDWQMNKRGLEKTDNYKNDLERLRSRGHLDPETAQLLQSYYRCISNIGVHERGAPPGIYEADMGYGITLIMLDYFANKLP